MRIYKHEDLSGIFNTQHCCREKGGSLGLASSKLSERPCLKGSRQRVTDTCVQTSRPYRHIHTKKRKRT